MAILIWSASFTIQFGPPALPCAQCAPMRSLGSKPGLLYTAYNWSHILTLFNKVLYFSKAKWWKTEKCHTRLCLAWDFVGYTNKRFLYSNFTQIYVRKIISKSNKITSVPIWSFSLVSILGPPTTVFSAKTLLHTQ